MTTCIKYDIKNLCTWYRFIHIDDNNHVSSYYDTRQQNIFDSISSKTAALNCNVLPVMVVGKNHYRLVQLCGQ